MTLTREAVTGITDRILGCAIAVHRALGPGLLETAYQRCLAYEFHRAELAFDMEVPVPIHYHGVSLGCGYRLDFLVQDTVIVEAKAVAQLLPIHTAQMLTYLRLMQLPVGLLLNFNVRYLPDGIRRVANGFLPDGQPDRTRAETASS